MQVRWTRKASEDLFRIASFIQRDNPAAANRIARVIYEDCQSLQRTPFRGRRGKSPETRELVFSPLPYVAIYQVGFEVIDILRIWHGAQSR